MLPKYQPVTDGWGQLDRLNQQGYGIYFVVNHGGDKNHEISGGSCLYHESDRSSLAQQQQEIDRISAELGFPTAVVKTRKSLHAYLATEFIPLALLINYQRRWLPYSRCDDLSLAAPAQLMRLPEFDHVAWNPESADLDRVPCELLVLNNTR